jgi:hypothetical protein
LGVIRNAKPGRYWSNTSSLPVAGGAVFSTTISVMAVSAGARADFKSSTELYEECAAQKGSCYDYVQGVFETMQGDPIMGYRICTAYVTPAQAAYVVVQ